MDSFMLIAALPAGIGVAIPIVLIFFTCLLIWRACDGFEVASEYIGRNLSEGVRGGTINAISSSLPELFTTLIALLILADKDGFSVGIGTTAGSALFNGMIIPAVCILAVVGTIVLGKQVTSVNVSRKVLLRDGLVLIFAEIVLIFLINGSALHWWQGVLLMAIYVAYLWYMLASMKQVDSDAAEQDDDDADDADDESRGVIGTFFYWVSGGPLLDLERFFVGAKQKQQMKEETWNGWPLLLTSTAVIGGACYFLVLACEWLGSGPGNESHPHYELFGHQFEGFGMPTMFVAVIFAAMATSVPDTVISIRDAKDGDYDDAVANALGSNVFDICFALGFPLFLYTIIYGSIEMNEAIIQQSGELRLLLLALTVAGFFVYYLGRHGVDENGIAYVEMKKGKAFLLLAIYVVFVAYIIGRSLDAGWANQISDSLHQILQWLPQVG